MVTLRFHGHSCWEIQGAAHRILIDPFLTGNPQADVARADVTALDAILVSHGHSDHLGDTVALAKQTGAVVIANYEIATYCAQRGCTIHPLHIGGGATFPFGHVRLTIAHHGSTGPEGEALGNPAGIVLVIDGKRLYHAGDTAVFLDMQLIAELYGPLDVALLPIGDNFTMGITEAVKATELLCARMHIPMHYNTFPYIEVNPEAFRRAVEAAGRKVVVIPPGGEYVVP
ncbi:MAG: metal-dependent hydrolase [Deltaproteobacteria bacterium]|nr:metal-dependent hydrolase [Deltaproteobacteria bacterium]